MSNEPQPEELELTPDQIYRREYYQKHRIKTNMQNNKYFADNKEEMHKKHNEYYQKNKEKLLRQQKERRTNMTQKERVEFTKRCTRYAQRWREKKIAEMSEQEYLLYKEEINRKCREYYARNKEAMQIRNQVKYKKNREQYLKRIKGYVDNLPEQHRSLLMKKKYIQEKERIEAMPSEAKAAYIEHRKEKYRRFHEKEKDRKYMEKLLTQTQEQPEERNITQVQNATSPSFSANVIPLNGEKDYLLELDEELAHKIPAEVEEIVEDPMKGLDEELASWHAVGMEAKAEDFYKCSICGSWQMKDGNDKVCISCRVEKHA